jgi:sec-independent protein translocase protein TatA
MSAVLGEIIGPDLLIVLAIVALLFGSSQLPKLARSLGSAKSQFEAGLRESHATSQSTTGHPMTGQNTNGQHTTDQHDVPSS